MILDRKKNKKKQQPSCYEVAAIFCHVAEGRS